jgi:2-polyprenyl-3-methyl-5-hydroxy-6-metoxy-1,4-benzoquinol methylase
VVIANHMLYHVPDPARALADFQRVLKPGGRLFASTIGAGHMQELHELVAKFDPELKTIDMGVVTFNLENGAELLGHFFSRVEMRCYEDSLEVTDPNLLADYVLSTASQPLSPGRRQDLVNFMREEIERAGSFHITKRSGIFLARV